MGSVLYLSPSVESTRFHVINQIHSIKQIDSFTPVCLLLPSSTTIHDMQAMLGSAANVLMRDFYRLGQAVLEAARSPVHELNDVAIRRLVHCLLAEMHERGELTTFNSVWRKPGFVHALVEWLREMKMQGIPPEDVSAYAGTSGEKDHQLALLYERYQAFMLEHDYSDTEGLLWLAAEALETAPNLFADIGPLFVLGFDQFTPLQRRILCSLATRLPSFEVYLHWDVSSRNEDSLALTRLRQTHDVLIEDLHPEIVQLDGDDNAVPELAHLQRTLFEPIESVAEGGAVQAIEAPSRETEVRRALRAIKRQVLDGVSLDQIGLLAPHPDAYRRIVEAVAEEYGIPAALEQPLPANPAVAALLNLLRLSPDFPWRETFDALRSPYIQQDWLSARQIDLLDQLTRERPVVAGREQWRYALQPLERSFDDTEDEDLGPPPLVSRLEPEMLCVLQEDLTAFFDHLTPPQTGTYHDFARWIQSKLLGINTNDRSLHMVKCCGDADDYARRDLRAMQCVTSTLRGLVQAADLVPIGDGVVAWDVYRDHVIEALSTGVHKPEIDCAVLRLGSLETGRARVVDHLYVLGLSEGEFPYAPAPDVFYDPAEREKHSLPLQRTDPAESASLWWQVVSGARCTLTLLRPGIDERGAPWPPSPYWDEVIERIEGLHIGKLRIDPQLAPEDAASPAELLVALARKGKPVPAHVQRAYQVMRIRKGWKPAGIYEGVLETPTLRDELAARYGPDRVWSASRLNRYGMCPFGFFADHVLKLAARPDPEAGFDAMQRGSLLHAILEKLYRGLAQDEIMPSATTQEDVLARLEAVCDDVFPTAPQRYGFRPGPLWQHEQAEMRRMLDVLVSWECAEGSAFAPYLQEVRFGLDEDGLGALMLQDAEGQFFGVRGVIDRIDRAANGDLRVIDYKSGSTGYSIADIEEGRALQSALYARAAEMLPDSPYVRESCYLHIPKRETSGRLYDESKKYDMQSVIDNALACAGEFVMRVRRGSFPVAPGKDSCRWCDFKALCRVNRQSRWKAQEMEEET